MNTQERIAKALFEDWQKSDRELTLTWETAGTPLQGVFLRQAEVALEALSMTLEHLVMFVHTAEALGESSEENPLSSQMEDWMDRAGLTI